MRTFSSFLGREIETQSGQALGRCRDLRASIGRDHATVEAIVVGRRGWLEHLGIAQAQPRGAVPWEAVLKIEGDRIVVRDGTEFV